MPPIIGFEVDGVLVQRWTIMLRPSLHVRLQQLRRQWPDARLFVATNQGGPLWRWHSAEQRQAGRRQEYPQAEEVGRRLASIATQADLADVPWLIATYDDRVRQARTDEENAMVHPEVIAQAIGTTIADIMQPFVRGPIYACPDPLWRKPNSGMLETAWEILGDPRRDPLIYIGSMPSDGDAVVRMMPRADPSAVYRYLDVEAWLRTGDLYNLGNGGGV